MQIQNKTDFSVEGLERVRGIVAAALGRFIDRIAFDKIERAPDSTLARPAGSRP